MEICHYHLIIVNFIFIDNIVWHNIFDTIHFHEEIPFISHNDYLYFHIFFSSHILHFVTEDLSSDKITNIPLFIKDFSSQHILSSSIFEDDIPPPNHIINTLIYIFSHHIVTYIIVLPMKVSRSKYAINTNT